MRLRSRLLRSPASSIAHTLPDCLIGSFQLAGLFLTHRGFLYGWLENLGEGRGNVKNYGGHHYRS